MLEDASLAPLARNLGQRLVPRQRRRIMLPAIRIGHVEHSLPEEVSVRVVLGRRGLLISLAVVVTQSDDAAAAATAASATGSP